MKTNFKKKLSIAASILIGSNSYCNASELDNQTKTSYSFLSYSEASGVSVTAPQFTASQQLNDNNNLSANIIYDTVSGASPTGAVPTGTVQTVTSSSGTTSTISATSKPTNSFNDTRIASNLNWQHDFSRLFKMTNGVSFSKENDYQSQSLSSNLSLDSNDRLTTFSLGFASTNDSISGTDKLDGVAGLPKILTNVLNKERQALTDNKASTEIKLGITQVINTKSLLLAAYTKSTSSGYHNDPYKQISVVDTNGSSVAGLYESRPTSRDRDIISLGYIKNIHGNVLKLNYRYFKDDWDIKSHTIDTKFRIKLGRAFSLEPHFRFYSQSAAYFHNYYIKQSDINNLPSYASADSRLANFNSFTMGIKAAINVRNYALTGRIESMQQYSNQNTSNAPGKLSQYNLFSDKNVTIVNVSFSVTF